MSPSGATTERAPTADDRPVPPSGREPSAGAGKERGGEGDAGQGGRSTAEWVTLAISALIVGGVVALTTYFHLTGGSGPAAIEVRPAVERVYRGGDRYYLPVDVTNVGQSTGEDVRVTVSLTDARGGRESSGLEIRFLPAGASSRGVVSFRSDPREGELLVEGVSYLEP